MTIVVSPQHHEMGVTEDLPIALDATNLLTGLANIAASVPTATLTDLMLNEDYDDGLNGDPTVQDTYVVQWLHDLEAGHHYLLKGTVTDSLGRTWEMQLFVDCV